MQASSNHKSSTSSGIVIARHLGFRCSGRLLRQDSIRRHRHHCHYLLMKLTAAQVS